MCGIVAATAARDVVPVLIAGLKALEYRGYDSAGISVLENGRLARVRAAGKVRELESLYEAAPVAGTSGIAHTRWATHGVPNTVNAHPHVSSERVAVVHNGIIENHAELRAELKAQGYRFDSDTDTEVIAHLVDAAISAGADRVTITSFNEWQEGTQIEPAIPLRLGEYRYISYDGAWGLHGVAAENAYLDRTAYWAALYRRITARPKP
jgi:glucosamine 6-phosphate synthetase-like amidotransferase/phosphosugar isomerase protein